MTYYFNLKKLHVFITILVLYLLIIFISKSVLINEIVFYNTYSGQLTFERAMALFNDLKRFSWIGYVLIPVILSIKFSAVSLILYIGAFLCNFHKKITVGEIFGVVIASEIVFVVAGLLKLFWFTFFAGNYDLNELSFFYPLSLSNFFKWSEVDNYWVPALQGVNLFQIIYMILLSIGIYLKANIQKAEAEKAVLISYAPMLCFWIVLMIFLAINSSYET